MIVKPLLVVFEQLWTSICGKLLKNHGNLEISWDWSKTKIALIFKIGKRKEYANYSLVGLILNLSKILEYIIKRMVNEYLEEEVMITTNQYGFTNSG